jgi:Na+:H+ antiporter, NhaC family
MASKEKQPTLFMSLLPIVFLICFLSLNVIIFKDATLEGSNQIILMLTAAVAALISMRYKTSWKRISEGILGNINKAMPAILILLLIGSLSGTWLLSGVVPAMIYYGLQIINPYVFLLTALLVSCIVSLVTGSSWSTIATIGVALFGIGKALDFNEGMVAGAIISGAYFGDKMSPLSDTTNLAPAVAGTDLFTHIRYMTITTGPTLVITIIIFTILGFTNVKTIDTERIEGVKQAIESSFHITPVLLIVPVILFIIIVKKVPPIPSLLAGTLLGALFAVIFQYKLILQLINDNTSEFTRIYQVVMQSMFGETHIESSNKIVGKLFTTSGMRGMLDTVWLILAAMIFGGTMEAAGMLRRITRSIMKLAKSDGSLITATIFTSIFFNLTASDQYISIVVPGRMYANSYKKRRLKPEVLSRTLEDGGTLTSVLVPWNTGGATQSRVLGVSTVTYLPYCFLNLINPFVAIIIAYAGFKIRKIEGDTEEDKEDM